MKLLNFDKQIIAIMVLVVLAQLWCIGSADAQGYTIHKHVGILGGVTYTVRPDLMTTHLLMRPRPSINLYVVPQPQPQPRPRTYYAPSVSTPVYYAPKPVPEPPRWILRHRVDGKLWYFGFYRSMRQCTGARSVLVDVLPGIFSCEVY